MTDKIYILYEWSNHEVKRCSKRKEAILAKIGEDVVAGMYVDDYHIIEIDLGGLEEWRKKNTKKNYLM